MKHTIYIVDDNPIVLEALVMMIADEEDIEVCGTAQSALEALDVIPKLNPDVVVADLSLPGMNGVELIERLRLLQPQLQAIILSAYMDSIHIAKALAAGAKAYIVKGDPIDLLHGIRNILDSQVGRSRQDLATSTID